MVFKFDTFLLCSSSGMPAGRALLWPTLNIKSFFKCAASLKRRCVQGKVVIPLKRKRHFALILTFISLAQLFGVNGFCTRCYLADKADFLFSYLKYEL